MAFVPVGQNIAVAMLYTQDGQKLQNNYNCNAADTIDETALLAVSAIFRAWEATTMSPLRASNAVWTGMILRNTLFADGIAIETDGAGPIVGQNTSGGFPNNVTLAVKLSGLQSGRSHRGRVYHVGLAKNQVADQEVVPTPLGQIISGYETLRSTLESAEFPLVVVSKISGGVERTTGVQTIITQISADSFIDSQRRRLPGRGQ